MSPAATHIFRDHIKMKSKHQNIFIEANLIYNIRACLGLYVCKLSENSG
nr:hypothetical protein [Bacillus sp. MUM 13]